MIKKLAYVLLTLIILLGIAYVVFLNIPQKTVSSNEAQFEMSATALFTEFSKNQTKADKKYIGKIIKVSGKILDLDVDQKGDKVVFLDTGDLMSSILCTMSSKESSKLSKYQMGDNISLVGSCSGMVNDVVLNRCILSK